MNTLARIKKAGKNFEIIVNLEQALKFKKGEIQSIEAEIDKIFTDSKKGIMPSTSDLQEAFGTTNTSEIIQKIVKEGEVQTTQEHRDEEREKKVKQIVDFLAVNSIDPQTKHSHSRERIKNIIKEANINIKNSPIENQITEIVAELSKFLPIKLETRRIKITIPAIYTGKAYGMVTQYKETEKWLNDGSLEVILNIPSGIIIDFYDKLNSVTHGSGLTEEIKNE